MKRIIEQIIKTFPQKSVFVQNNHNIVKRQNIYIPYREIGLSCLTREVKEINLFFEIILKLIVVGIHDIDEIANILGVDYKLLKEVIVDMVIQDYILTSANQISISQKGEKALLERKLTTINQENFNSIYVNMITGEIFDDLKVKFSGVSKNDICLLETTNLDQEFLDKNYQMFNELYHKNLLESITFGTKFLEKEIYRILEIIYEKGHYLEEELIVLKNKNSNEFDFIITGDKGKDYVSTFFKQVKDIVYPGVEQFFEKNYEFIKKQLNLSNKPSIVSEEDKKRKEKLINKLLEKEIDDELVNVYTQRRELIDNKEIDYFFLFNHVFSFEGIIISCERLEPFLNEIIVESINQLSEKRTWLLYNRDERNIHQYLNQKFNKHKNNVSFIEREEAEPQFVCFYPNILIEFTEIVESVFSKYITILEAVVEFDTDNIKRKIDKVIYDKQIKFSFKNSLKRIK